MSRHQDQFAPIVREWVIHGQPRTMHSRQSIEPFFKLAVERGQLRLGIGRWRIVQLNQHASRNLVAKVLVLQLVEAARQHGRARHQHH